MSRKKLYAIIAILVVVACGGLLLYTASQEPEVRDIVSPPTPTNATEDTANTEAPSQALQSQFPDVDFSQSTIPFELVFSGGPPRDGIPALSNPSFDSLSLSVEDDETLGIFIQSNSEKKFYPYTVLVWHEIVNDTIDGQDVAVTFCPLCGSAIVFDRNVDGTVREFGVSGFLFESNMLMYDRTDTPSLWSQARGEAVIGDEQGQSLSIVDFQLLSLADVRELHPDTLVLSRDTGFSRDYGFDPYSGYEDTDETSFPISIDDQRHPAKEIFYIVQTDDASIAIQQASLNRGDTAQNESLGLRIEKTDNGELNVQDSSGRELPGYFEMWFSWAQHHQDKGEVWSI